MLKNKNAYIFLLLIALIISMGACVTNKQRVYLQKDDLYKDTSHTDSISRSYTIAREPYRIKPEDILMVNFNSLTEQEYDFFQKAQPPMQGGGGGGAAGMLFALRGEMVDPEGNIYFPVVGKVQVEGLTLFEVQDKLQTIAEKYLEEPIVRVRLVNFRATFLGEMKNEGVYTTVNPQVSILEAIGAMGGLTEMADRANIKVIRQDKGQNHIFYINLLDEELIQSDKFWLHQNDIIVIPSLKQRTFATYTRQNIAIFASTISAGLLVVNLILNPPNRDNTN